MATTIPTPGILYTASKLTSPALLNEPTYLHWYEDIHIRDVLQTRGFTTAYRYDAVRPAADRPYLLLYPMRDLSFVRTKEFTDISVTSHLFPSEGKACWDFADFDVRQFVPEGTYKADGGGEAVAVGTANLLVTLAVTLRKDNAFDFGQWLSEGDGSALRELRGFRGAKWYQMVFAMRFPPQMSMEDLQKQEVPRTYMAMLDFDGVEVTADDLGTVAETSLAKKVREGIFKGEVGVWKLKKILGDVSASL